ncbi:MAG: putative porin, partial [Flavobacteriaceae bacterium]
MKFRFLGVIVVITNLAFGQQSNSLDSLSVAPVEKVQNSISLTPKDTLRIPRDKMVLDSLIKKDLDTISVDSLSRKKDPIQLEKSNKKKKRKRRAARRRFIEIDTISLINNYKAYYEDGREVIVDTTLTVQKDYKFNFLRKDYFELLPLANVAQGFNRMGYDFRDQPMGPKLGAQVNQYGFFETEDIPYYEVATPLTELFFRTTFEQGELVDALVTVNPSHKLNLMVAYKGLRSLGRYQSSRSNGGQFRGSINFNDAQERYQLRAHFVAQTRENQVNGGLSDQGVYFFENAPYYPEVDAEGNVVLDENGEVVEVFYDGFLDRSRLANNLRATSILSGRRF